MVPNQPNPVANSRLDGGGGTAQHRLQNKKPKRERESMKLDRRTFLASASLASATLAAPAVMGQARPRVVVIGGGSGGGTVARYLAVDGAGAIDVTLIEPSKRYYTCYFSNLYLGGFWDFEALGHGYGTIARTGVNVIHDWAVGVDRDAKTVALASGESVPYDRLVVAPGIDFVDGSVPGWNISQQGLMPHAYKSGTQVQLLKHQIENMRQGGTFCMVAPPNPYRCPPGPGERVSMVAHMLSQSNPTAKILIVDPKESYSKQALFEEGWEKHYPGMVSRIGPDIGGAQPVRSAPRHDGSRDRWCRRKKSMSATSFRRRKQARSPNWRA
jgi:sulfide dehydrogenase [flavocytochrome c] flavoprotein chain